MFTKIKYHRMERDVIDILGPGRRTVVWVQGCSRRCPGCIAPEMWDSAYGSEITPLDLVGLILSSPCDGLTVSGGEPFDQAASLALLLAAVREAGKTTWVYTGYTHQELLWSDDHDVAKMLTLIDVLVDGPFDAEKAGSFLWRGSSNQQIIHLTGRIPDADEQNMIGGRWDIRLDNNGHAIFIGIPTKNFFSEFLGKLKDNGIILNFINDRITRQD